MADKRPSFEEINMRMAMLVAERSTCKRLQVGCIITSTDFRKILLSRTIELRVNYG